MNESDHVGREVILAGVAYIAILGFTLLPTTHSLAVWLLPMPLIALWHRRIRWAPAMMALVATLLLVVLGYGWFACLYGFGVYFMGWAMGESLQHGHSPYYALIFGTLTVVMLEMVRLAMYHWAGFDLYEDIKTALLEGLQQDPSLSDETASSFAGNLVERIRLLTPSILCIMGFLISALNLFGARLILGWSKVAQGMLSRFRLPESVAPVYVIALTVVLFQWGQDSTYWWQVCNNVAFLAGFFIGIQGLAFIWRRMGRLRGRYILMAVLVLITPIPFVGSIYVLVGLLSAMPRIRRY